MHLKLKAACIMLAIVGLGGSQCLGEFRYADNVTTTGGQFNNSASYAPANLVNNGFTSPTNAIDTRVDYLAAGNNYATLSGTTANFDLTFNFNTPVDLSAMYVWNYVFRNGTGGATSTNSGVNAFTLTFHSEANGLGALLGTYSGNLARAVWNGLNQAETVAFGTTNSGVRSVVMQVVSNYGGGFTGMNEVGFETVALLEPPAITSFAASTNWVTFGSAATLTWTVSPGVTNLVIENGVGDVMPLTTNGNGSIQVSPTRGVVTYSLVANNAVTNIISLIGLPPRGKLHLYLLLGQSNMQGAGRPYDANLDSPHPRVLQFGSRDGMEPIWLQAKHPLTSLNAGYTSIGPGHEFARTMLASNSDPELG
ncbi:MAG: sialate O-acetylesterase, partial [Verrucomicrobiota bacterium]